MARPLRLEFPGAVYHITARGNERRNIFVDDEDRRCFLDRLGREIEQHGWLCHAYCLMSNHYHLLLETPQPNLARGMRRLNGSYTQAFNRRHKRVGHLFQGRYKGILVDRDSYLLELSRYVVLNPVRARMVADPAQYEWSSYRATADMHPPPPWLHTKDVLGYFEPTTEHAPRRYAQFVHQGLEGASPWAQLRGQVWLGSAEFRERMEKQLGDGESREIPRTQQRPTQPTKEEVLGIVAEHFGIAAADAISKQHRVAYHIGAYLLRRAANLPLNEVAQFFGVSPSRISHIQRKIEAGEHREALDSLNRALGSNRGVVECKIKN
jgi:REP element-mobilizing transposase RayT